MKPFALTKCRQAPGPELGHATTGSVCGATVAFVAGVVIA